MTNDELDLVPHDELVAALGRRYETFGLVYLDEHTSKPSWGIRFTGSRVALVGLFEYGKDEVINQMREQRLRDERGPGEPS